MTEYTFAYWTDRKKSIFPIRLEKTSSGWVFHAIAHSGPTTPDGKPFLIRNFEQDNVDYPSGVDGFLEHVWQELDGGRIDRERGQIMLDQITEWVSETEKRKPKWKAWNMTAWDIAS